MRNGAEIWIDSNRVKLLQDNLVNLKSHVFINYDDRTINTADITGIFCAKDMDDIKRRKNGQWQCENGNWHDKFKKCNCKETEKINKELERIKISKECNLCNEGYILMISTNNTEEMLPCKCIYKTIGDEKLSELKKYIDENGFKIK